MDLFEARVKQRITQWDLSIRIGISQSKISLVERGYISPTDIERSLIAGALGYEVDQIVWPEKKRTVTESQLPGYR